MANQIKPCLFLKNNLRYLNIFENNCINTSRVLGYSYAREKLVTEDSSPQLVKARRRMRGSATFFIVVSVIGALGAGILLAVGDDRFNADDLFGRVVLAVGLISAGLAAWNGSRLASTGLVLLLLITPLTALAGFIDISPSEWVRSVLYTALAVFMTLGAFRYCSLSKAANHPIGGLVWLRWTGTLVTSAVVLFLGFGISVLLIGTPTAVVRGADISEEQLEWLVEKGFLYGGEKPLYLYLDGAFSIVDGGSLLTDEYVGGWWQHEGELDATWIPLGQVCEVKTVQEGSYFEDAIYSVHTPGDELWVQLWLSIEGDLHKRFISRMKTINNRKMRPEVKRFCEENRPIDWAEIAASNGISADIVRDEGVTDPQRAWLVEQKYLLENEQILNFYSYGKFAIEEGGTLLTDKYFGGWYQSNGELGSRWLALGDLCGITSPEDITEGRNAVYAVTGPNESGLDLSLPTTDNQAEALVQRVLDLNAAKATDQSRSACELAENQTDNDTDD